MKLLEIIGLSLIILGILFFFTFYILHEVNSCTRNPINYEINKLKQDYGEETTITGQIIVQGNNYGFVQEFGEINKTIFKLKK